MESEIINSSIPSNKVNNSPFRRSNRRRTIINSIIDSKTTSLHNNFEKSQNAKEKQENIRQKNKSLLIINNNVKSIESSVTLDVREDIVYESDNDSDDLNYILSFSSKKKRRQSLQCALDEDFFNESNNDDSATTSKHSEHETLGKKSRLLKNSGCKSPALGNYKSYRTPQRKSISSIARSNKKTVDCSKISSPSTPIITGRSVRRSSRGDDVPLSPTTSRHVFTPASNDKSIGNNNIVSDAESSNKLPDATLSLSAMFGTPRKKLRLSVSPTASTSVADDLHQQDTVILLPLKGFEVCVDVRSSDRCNRTEAFMEPLRALGATVTPAPTATTTHCVFRNGLKRTYQRCQRLGVPLVSCQWVDACVRQQQLVSAAEYPSLSLDTYANPPKPKPAPSKPTSVLTKDFAKLNKLMRATTKGGNSNRSKKCGGANSSGPAAAANSDDGVTEEHLRSHLANSAVNERGPSSSYGSDNTSSNTAAPDNNKNNFLPRSPSLQTRLRSQYLDAVRMVNSASRKCSASGDEVFSDSDSECFSTAKSTLNCRNERKEIEPLKINSYESPKTTNPDIISETPPNEIIPSNSSAENVVDSENADELSGRQDNRETKGEGSPSEVVVRSASDLSTPERERRRLRSNSFLSDDEDYSTPLATRVYKKILEQQLQKQSPQSAAVATPTRPVSAAACTNKYTVACSNKDAAACTNIYTVVGSNKDAVAGNSKYVAAITPKKAAAIPRRSRRLSTVFAAAEASTNNNLLDYPTPLHSPAAVLLHRNSSITESSNNSPILESTRTSSVYQAAGDRHSPTSSNGPHINLSSISSISSGAAAVASISSTSSGASCERRKSRRLSAVLSNDDDNSIETNDVDAIVDVTACDASEAIDKLLLLPYRSDLTLDNSDGGSCLQQLMSPPRVQQRNIKQKRKRLLLSTTLNDVADEELIVPSTPAADSANHIVASQIYEQFSNKNSDSGSSNTRRQQQRNSINNFAKELMGVELLPKIVNSKKRKSCNNFAGVGRNKSATTCLPAIGEEESSDEQNGNSSDDEFFTFDSATVKRRKSMRTVCNKQTITVRISESNSSIDENNAINKLNNNINVANQAIKNKSTHVTATSNKKARNGSGNKASSNKNRKNSNRHNSVKQQHKSIIVADDLPSICVTSVHTSEVEVLYPIIVGLGCYNIVSRVDETTTVLVCGSRSDNPSTDNSSHALASSSSNASTSNSSRSTRGNPNTPSDSSNGITIAASRNNCINNSLRLNSNNTPTKFSRTPIKHNCHTNVESSPSTSKTPKTPMRVSFNTAAEPVVPRRTVNLLLGSLRGVQLCSPQWLYGSLQRGHWLPVQPHPALDDFCPAARIVREQKETDPSDRPRLLLDGDHSGPYYVHPRTRPPAPDMQELLTLCGATVTDNAAEANVFIWPQLDGPAETVKPTTTVNRRKSTLATSETNNKNKTVVDIETKLLLKRISQKKKELQQQPHLDKNVLMNIIAATEVTDALSLAASMKTSNNLSADIFDDSSEGNRVTTEYDDTVILMLSAGSGSQQRRQTSPTLANNGQQQTITHGIDISANNNKTKLINNIVTQLSNGGNVRNNTPGYARSCSTVSVDYPPSCSNGTRPTKHVNGLYNSDTDSIVIVHEKWLLDTIQHYCIQPHHNYTIASLMATIAQ